MKKQLLLIALIVLILLGIIGGVYYLILGKPKKISVINPPKVPGTAQVSLSSRKLEAGVGEATKQVVLKIKNTSDSKLEDVKVVSVVVNFNPGLNNKFSLDDIDIVCDPFFTTKMPSSIKDGSVYFTCASLGVPLTLNSQEEKNLATLNFKTLPNAVGSVDLDLGEIIIPDRSLNNLGISAY